MEVTLLVKSIVGLVVILAILLSVFLYSQAGKKTTKQKKKVEKKKVHTDPQSLEYLLEIIRDKSSTTKELKEALELILKHHGNIHPKLGMRTHPDFDIYSEILLRICRHPNTTKDLIIKFDRELERLNPQYVREINDSLTKGLNSRGF